MWLLYVFIFFKKNLPSNQPIKYDNFIFVALFIYSINIRVLINVSKLANGINIKERNHDATNAVIYNKNIEQGC